MVFRTQSGRLRRRCDWPGQAFDLWHCFWLASHCVWDLVELLWVEACEFMIAEGSCVSPEFVD